MRTMADILAQLKQLDEVTLVEMLGISAEDLVDRFQDLVENDPEKFNLELEQWSDDDDEEN